MDNSNNLFTLGLDVSATQQQMDRQLKQIAKALSDSKSVQVTGGLNLEQSQKQIQAQLNTIAKNLKVGVQLDTTTIKQQTDAINRQLSSGINAAGVKVPFKFDLSDANAVKQEINKIVADITNNQGKLVRFKINVDDNGQATKALLTYRNELNEVTNATLKLQSVGKWYDSNGLEHHIVKWSEGQKTLSQNIEATVKANQRQIESDNQVIRKKEELIAQMKLLNTQAEKAGLSLNSENQNAFNDLSVNASTLEDIKQLESYLRLARTEYQTFNAEISKGTHASALEAMKNALQSMPNDIALLEARFNSIKMPEGVSVQIEQLKADLQAINSIADPNEKIAKYNEMVASLQNLQKQYQITSQEQKNLNADQQAMQGAGILTNKIITWMNGNRDAASQYDAELKKIIIDLQNCNSKTDLTKLQQQFKQIQTQTQATDSVSQGFFGNLKSQVKSSIATMLKYQLAYKIIQKTVQSIKQMIKAVCDLDATLTEFNKVADLSTEKLSEFADKAFDAATKIGRTGKDMIEAATEFKRAGYDLEQSLEMGNAALVMTNVADGINQTSDAASTLISVLKGFNISDADIMSIVDKMNSVSNQSPVGFDNLADGLERVSGTMSQAGNSIDETIGLLTGGFAQLRNMEKVSTGLITISQRLRAVDEDGDEIDGLSAELEESFGSIGVAIEDANGELRSTFDILSDYAKVFPELTSEQKQYFAELASGKRQVNVFNAIIQQMADVDKAVEQSIDSVGAAEKENEIYRQSIQGLKNEFDNQFQMLATEVISSDWIKDLISAGTDLLEVLTNIVKQDDLISGTISVITDGIKGFAEIIKEISGNKVVGSLIKGFLTMQTVSKGMDIFNFFQNKKNNQNAMNAFFQSAINGTMQVKDGFLQIGEAEKQVFNNKTSGFGKQVLLLVS
ncbi:MAG: phage tail tape measure protein [Candidatus Gastranaerophilales bacterium]|nr:phage tail tape measure protein [Candidatus Gastranaerophilales bacterium]